MTIGARIRQGDGSLIQIDPSYENLALKALGTVTTTQYASSGAGANAGKATIIAAGCNEPILAFACPDAFVGLRVRSKSGTTVTWEIVTSAPVVNVQYWVFDTTDVAQMAFNLTKGLRIRNPANNRVIFDSRYKYMRIQGMIKANVGTSPSSFPVAQGTGYAIGVSNSGAGVLVSGGPVGGGPYWLNNDLAYVAGFKTLNGSVQLQMIQLALRITDGPSNPPPTGQFGSFQAVGLVLDLRNY